MKTCENCKNWERYTQKDDFYKLGWCNLIKENKYEYLSCEKFKPTRMKKRHINVTIDEDLYQWARTSGINISFTLRNILKYMKQDNEKRQTKFEFTKN